MNQQYVLLRKENDLLNSLIGQSFNEKSKFEAEKILNEIHSKAESRLISKKALCYIVDDSEIKGVGGSTLIKDRKSGEIVSNLILDQFGIWLAGIFGKVSAVDKVISIKDSTGVLKTVQIYFAAGIPFNGITGGTPVGIALQVGSGITVPARSDFNIETAFGTAPESGLINPTSDPVFSTALGNFKTNVSIIAGGAGTINESIAITNWRDNVPLLKEFVLFRDIISPGQAFVLGQTIALEYTVQL